ncbi:MAG: NAD(P)-dependent oxidoreductase [Bacteroidales bacterium]|nr:NAD(P)-dependent oxidoreductase [Bacteroidales bacterium]
MKNVLLIGGAGYIGTVLTSHFLARGYRITVLDNFTYNNQFAVLPFLGEKGFRLISGDMNNPSLLEEASKGVEDVVLLAGLVGDPITKKYPIESGLINEKGVRHCMDYFTDKEISKMIFVSTCSNYGSIKENEMADENFRLNPLSLYAKAKVSNERYLLDKKGNANYAGVILRFATAFGPSPRMRFDLTVSEFVRDLFFGRELVVFDENTWRPYCHVRDFARLIELVLNSDNATVGYEVFNAGGEVNNCTKKMIVESILEIIPNGMVKYTDNGGDPRNYRVSFEKVKKTLGFIPEYSVMDGIMELIDGLRNGIYADSVDDKNRYGNYEISYSAL